MELRDADRLILLMLSEIYRKLGMTNQEVDPEFIQHVIFNRHEWAIDWRMPGLAMEKGGDPPAVKQVVDILDMWGMLEDAIDRLPAPEREKVEKSPRGYTRPTKFAGFDGNNEAEHLGIAHTFIEHLDRFTRFEGRDLNSHHQTLDRALRMVREFEPMRSKIGARIGRGEQLMTAEEIIQVLDA